MRIEYLKLLNFRNYRSLELRPGNLLNVLVGDNAQGKTNVLESIFLLAAGRSHRTSRDSELIMRSQPGAYARVELARGDGISHRVEMKLLSGGKKQAKLDGAPALRMADLIGCLNAVVFSPEDLRLVKDGPMERRRFMDMELSQVRVRYFSALVSYSRALSQRNALLKELAAGKDCPELAAFDGILIDCGRQIISMRQEFMREIAALAGQLHKKISGGEELGVAYLPDAHPDELGKVLSDSLADDIRRGATGRGPHKDDIALTIGGSELRSYGSQGQQRTAALALKLSEIDLMHQISGEWPVLLLDDVLSELDEKRQGMLLESVGQCQTILTCTSEPEGIGGQVFRVKAGGITANKP